MGRRAKRMSPTVGLRYRMERLSDPTRPKISSRIAIKAMEPEMRLLATAAASRWGYGKAITGFIVAHFHRMPTDGEIGNLIDNGTIGRWVDSFAPRESGPIGPRAPKKKRESRRNPAWKIKGDAFREASKLEKEKGEAERRNAAILAKVRGMLGA